VIRSDPIARARVGTLADPAAVRSTGWLESDAATWRNGWQSWADLREKLHIEHAIPSHYRLHATHFAGAHGNPSTRPGWNRHKGSGGTSRRLRVHYYDALGGGSNPPGGDAASGRDGRITASRCLPEPAVQPL
jgi:hypothetical protein